MGIVAINYLAVQIFLHIHSAHSPNSLVGFPDWHVSESGLGNQAPIPCPFTLPHFKHPTFKQSDGDDDDDSDEEDDGPGMVCV